MQEPLPETGVLALISVLPKGQPAIHTDPFMEVVPQPKNWGSKTLFASKNLWLTKIIGPKNIGIKNIFLVEKYFFG